MQTILNDWLRTVRADGLVLVRTRVAGAWGLSVAQRDAVMFHFVAEGRAYVRQAGADTLELRPGDLVMLPRGGAHELIHAPDGRSIPQAEFMAARDGLSDSAADASLLICGEFNLDRHLALPAMRALPAAVLLRANSSDAQQQQLQGPSALADTLRLLRAEVETPHFGNQIVVRNLLSMLFVYFMRDWAERSAPAAAATAATDTAAGGAGATAAATANDWFAAVRAPHTARALACIHEAPERDWTLQALAKEAGLSRAAFARQFAASVGEPPHNYLTRWRMGIAAQLLADTDLRLAEIAGRVGYQSEFSFSRAFKRARGVAPTGFRRGVGYVTPN